MTEKSITQMINVMQPIMKCDYGEANGRIYSEHMLKRAVEEYQAAIKEKRIYGELNHPEESKMENKTYEEYFSGLTPQQQKMLKQGLASIKQWGENEYEIVPEVDKEDGQKKYRNNAEQKQAMKSKQIAARRKKNKIKHR